jgi:hypothetical protein
MQPAVEAAVERQNTTARNALYFVTGQPRRLRGTTLYVESVVRARGTQGIMGKLYRQITELDKGFGLFETGRRIMPSSLGED